MKIIFFNMLFEMGTLGALNVTTYLRKNGYPVKDVYLTKWSPETDDEVKAIMAFVERERPDLVGFSLMTFNFNRTKRITQEIKERFRDTKIVWGGIHPTFLPEESIQYADYVCVGEGEDATLELVRALDKGKPDWPIKNIWRKEQGKTIKSDIRPLIQNLDDYPFPAIDWGNTYCLDNGDIKELTHELYKKYVNYNGTMCDIMVSRGCPFSCSYCCNTLFQKIYHEKGKYLRYRSVDNVIEELVSIREAFPYVNMVNIQDDGFVGAKEEYLEEFSAKYKQKIGLPLRLRIIPTMINERKMKLLAEANTLTVVMGLQGNDRLNKEVYNRRVDSEKFISVARMIRKFGMVGQYDVIVANPYATEHDMVEICRIMARVPKPYKLETYKLAFFPNTPLWKKAVEDGMDVSLADGYSTPYGGYPEKFEYLVELLEACQYTPRALIEFFLKTRESQLAQRAFKVWQKMFLARVDRFRKKILKDTGLVRLTWQALFFQKAITRQIKSFAERKK